MAQDELRDKAQRTIDAVRDAQSRGKLLFSIIEAIYRNEKDHLFRAMADLHHAYTGKADSYTAFYSRPQECKSAELRAIADAKREYGMAVADDLTVEPQP